MANKGKSCSVDGCNAVDTGLRRGMCRKHYRRFMQNGEVENPVGRCRRWMDAHIGFQGDECLQWPFSRTHQGYGEVRMDGRRMLAHRAMAVLSFGQPEGKKDAAHSCGKGHLGCVNPKHLRWDTRSGNFADKIAHGTHNRGEKSPVAKLTNAEVVKIRSLAGSASHSEIARMFGVCASNICLIINGKSRVYG